MQNTLWTIGHSTHTINRFMELLNSYSIQEVWDVRSHPYSKYNRHFHKENIEQELIKNGFAYTFMGYELGGRSLDSKCYDTKGKLQYNCVTKLASFQKGVNQLVEKTKNSRIALMCSEKEPVECHRTILICRDLCHKGHFSAKNIQHILFDGSCQTQLNMEEMLIEKFNIYPDMFRSKEECINLAYNQQAQNIAYTYKENPQLKEGILHTDLS